MALSLKSSFKELYKHTVDTDIELVLFLLVSIAILLLQQILTKHGTLETRGKTQLVLSPFFNRAYHDYYKHASKYWLLHYL